MISIPLSNGAVNAHQIFQVELGDNTVEFYVNWNTTEEYWSADLYVEGELKCAGVILLVGDELLGVYNAGLGRLVMAGTDPTLDNLGTDNQLIWISDDE